MSAPPKASDHDREFGELARFTERAVGAVPGSFAVVFAAAAEAGVPKRLRHLLDAPEVQSIIRSRGFAGREAEVLRAVECFDPPKPEELSAISGVMTATAFQVARACRLVAAVDKGRKQLQASARAAGADRQRSQAYSYEDGLTPEERRAKYEASLKPLRTFWDK